MSYSPDKGFFETVLINRFTTVQSVVHFYSNMLLDILRPCQLVTVRPESVIFLRTEEIKNLGLCDQLDFQQLAQHKVIIIKMNSIYDSICPKDIS